MLRSWLFVPAVLFAAAPGEAASYSAQLEAPVSQRFLAPDIVWTCAADGCQGSTVESRPIVICESLAKRAGRVSAFLADGRAFAPAELGKCNGAAKVGTARGLPAR